MKAFLCLLLLCGLCLYLNADIDKNTYCESCLAAAQEIQEVLKKTSIATRPEVVENLMSRKLCDTISSSDKMKTACRHLLASNHEEFKEALLNGDPKKLKVVLCYERSKACMGVKRHSFTDDKASFTESDIEALIQDNKDNIRVSKPVQLSRSTHIKDEM